MTTSKDTQIQIRLKSQLKAEFQQYAEFKGLTPTALLHSLIVKTVYEAKKEMPEIFTQVETFEQEADQPQIVGDEDITQLGLKPVKAAKVKKVNKKKTP